MHFTINIRSAVTEVHNLCTYENEHASTFTVCDELAIIKQGP
jgi:hypothetical protein